MSRKNCFIPSCPNTSRNSNKIFITLPKKEKIRRKWYEAAGLSLRKGGSYFCCEDHFNLSEDAENFSEYNLMSNRLFMKSDVVPHNNLQLCLSPTTSQLSDSERKRKLENIHKYDSKFKASVRKVLEFDDLSKEAISNHFEENSVWIKTEETTVAIDTEETNISIQTEEKYFDKFKTPVRKVSKFDDLSEEAISNHFEEVNVWIKTEETTVPIKTEETNGSIQTEENYFDKFKAPEWKFEGLSEEAISNHFEETSVWIKTEDIITPMETEESNGSKQTEGKYFDTI